MNEWKTVRLGDVCEVITGSTPSTKNEHYYCSNDIPFVKPSDLPTDFFSVIDSSEFYLSEEARNVSRLVPKNSVLVSCIGIIGKTGITNREVSFNQQINALIPNPNEIDYKYLASAILSKKKYISEKANAAVVPIINKTEFSNLQIPLPSLGTQKQIATQLDKCTSIIAKYKQMLEKYDTLIKSRFIEMFGDPILNPKQWSVEKLKTLTSKIGSGATPKGGRESYISEGISLVRSMNVYKGYFEYDGLAHITEEQARELDNVTLQENDVLINITGASVARCCILPKAVLPARVNQHVSILRTTDKLNSVYLSNLLITDTEQRVLLGIGGAGGATREAITKTELETLDIPVPPMSLQNDFASFVQQIDKSKFEIANSLKRLYNKGMLS